MHTLRSVHIPSKQFDCRHGLHGWTRGTSQILKHHETHQFSWPLRPPHEQFRLADAHRPSRLPPGAVSDTELLHRVVVLGAAVFFKAPHGFVARALLSVAIVIPMMHFRVHVVSSTLRGVRHFLVRFGTATYEFHVSLCIIIVQSFPCRCILVLHWTLELQCEVNGVLNRATLCVFVARCCFVFQCKFSCWLCYLPMCLFNVSFDFICIVISHVLLVPCIFQIRAHV